MTGRELLNRRKRWLAAAPVAAGALLVSGLALLRPAGEVVALVLIVPGVAVIVAAAVGRRWFALRCPWCRSDLNLMLMHTGWWRLDPKVRYCAYCAGAFDDEAPAAGGWTDATAARWDDPVE
jgi:hypothetical protein